MPFTPFHMGPGILVKAVLQGSFSLMIFGWTQIVMDIQPLLAILTGEGKYHGWTHTYFGSTFLAIFAALTGKYLSQWALGWFSNPGRRRITIRWWVAFLSAFIGAYSHILLDSFTHTDMWPLAPFSKSNPLLGLTTLAAMYRLCVLSGIVGAVFYFAVRYVFGRNESRRHE